MRDPQYQIAQETISEFEADLRRCQRNLDRAREELVQKKETDQRRCAFIEQHEEAVRDFLKRLAGIFGSEGLFIDQENGLIVKAYEVERRLEKSRDRDSMEVFTVDEKGSIQRKSYFNFFGRLPPPLRMHKDDWQDYAAFMDRFNVPFNHDYNYAAVKFVNEPGYYVTRKVFTDYGHNDPEETTKDAPHGRGADLTVYKFEYVIDVLDTRFLPSAQKLLAEPLEELMAFVVQTRRQIEMDTRLEKAIQLMDSMNRRQAIQEEASYKSQRYWQQREREEERLRQKDSDARLGAAVRQARSPKVAAALKEGGIHKVGTEPQTAYTGKRRGRRPKILSLPAASRPRL